MQIDISSLALIVMSIFITTAGNVGYDFLNTPHSEKSSNAAGHAKFAGYMLFLIGVGLSFGFRTLGLHPMFWLVGVLLGGVMMIPPIRYLLKYGMGYAMWYVSWHLSYVCGAIVFGTSCVMISFLSGVISRTRENPQTNLIQALLILGASIVISRLLRLWILNAKENNPEFIVLSWLLAAGTVSGYFVVFQKGYHAIPEFFTVASSVIVFCSAWLGIVRAYAKRSQTPNAWLGHLC